MEDQLSLTSTFCLPACSHIPQWMFTQKALIPTPLMDEAATDDTLCEGRSMEQRLFL